MSQPKKIAFLVVWLIVATLLYAKTWYANLEYFPDYPAWVGIVIGRFKNLISNEDDPELLHTAYMLILSFINICLITAAAYLLRRLIRRKKSSRMN